MSNNKRNSLTDTQKQLEVLCLKHCSFEPFFGSKAFDSLEILADSNLPFHLIEEMAEWNYDSIELKIIVPYLSANPNAFDLIKQCRKNFSGRAFFKLIKLLNNKRISLDNLSELLKYSFIEENSKTCCTGLSDTDQIEVIVYLLDSITFDSIVSRFSPDFDVFKMLEYKIDSYNLTKFQQKSILEKLNKCRHLRDRYLSYMEVCKALDNSFTFLITLLIASSGNNLSTNLVKSMLDAGYGYKEILLLSDSSNAYYFAESFLKAKLSYNQVLYIKNKNFSRNQIEAINKFFIERISESS